MPTHQWHLEVTENARKDIRKLSNEERRAIFRAIRELLEADNPTFAPDIKKLVGDQYANIWRKRQGVYRIFYTLEADEVTFYRFTYKGVLRVLAVRHRKDAY